MSIARKAGPPPCIPLSAWTTFMDLFELLNEFAVYLIEVRRYLKPVRTVVKLPCGWLQFRAACLV